MRYPSEPGRPGKRAMLRTPPALAEQSPAPVHAEPTQTLASLLHSEFSQQADADAGVVVPDPGVERTLPSEIAEADPEPTFGSPGMRVPLHKPSEAAMAAGFGQPSADTPAEPVPVDTGFKRASLGQRIPFGVREQRLAWPPIKGFHLHWFNDAPGAIRRAELAGYTFVEDRGRKVTTVVGTDRAGKPLSGYLMKILEEWWKEDMAAREAEQRAILGAIQKGRFEAPENSYSRQGSIRIDQVLQRR
jgi:hypothetical protein